MLLEDVVAVPGDDASAPPADLGSADAPPVDVPTCPPGGGECNTLVWDPSTSKCVLTHSAEGEPCGAASCVASTGTCTAGTCIPGPPPCQSDDPDGCFTEHCDDTTVSCVRTDAPDGTPCSGGRWCVGGSCEYVPACTVAGDATTRQYDGSCAGNAGCAERCIVGACDCWRCDGPFCVEAGCDHSVDNPAGPTQAKVPLGALPDEPKGGVPAEPQPIVTAAASVSLAEGGSLSMQLVFAYPGIPDSAVWGDGKTEPLVAAKIAATRLLVLKSSTVYAQCVAEPVTAAEGGPEVLAPTLGDGSTVEFEVLASPYGVTVLAVVRVLETHSGARYLQWVRLGGVDVTADSLPGEPLTLSTEVLEAMPVSAAEPLGSLWTGTSWAAAVLATLP